jgi:hypothetical protein
MNQFMPEFPGKPLLGSNILFRNNVWILFQCPKFQAFCQ